MLYIEFGDFTDDCITKINSYFDIAKQKDWFNSEEVKSIIKEIDKSDAIKDEYIESPVLGAISPSRLSCGCKAVILMSVLDNPHIYATKCGDNCGSKILEISSRKDVKITLHHYFKFPEPFAAKLLNFNNKVINSNQELSEALYEFKSRSR